MKHWLQNPWLLLTSLVLNLLLLAAFVYTLQKAQHYYKEYRAFRPQAHGVSAATTLELPQNHEQRRFVLFGDSRVQEWQPLPQLDNTLVINAGVSGETALEALRRLDHDVLRLQPHVVLIQLGMNDLTAAATRGIKKPDKLMRQMKSSMEEIIDRLMERNVRVVLTPVIPAKPLSVVRKLFWRDELDPLLADVNMFLKGLADEHALQWIDLLVPLYDENGNLRTDWYFDTLHLHQGRYDAFNGLVAEALTGALGKDSKATH